MNLFTKAGQTTGLTASKHVEVIETYAGRRPDKVIMHTGSFTKDVLGHYALEQEYPVVDSLGDDPSVVREDVVSVHVVPPLAGDPVPRSLVRHDSGKLGLALSRLIS